MPELDYENPIEMVRWAEERIEGCSFRDDATAIGIRQGDRLRAVVVFDTFSTTGCFIHVATDGGAFWLGRKPKSIIAPILAYPFVQLGCSRVSTYISADNYRSLRLAKRCGGTIEGVMREAGSDGKDLLLLGMLRRECKWLSLAALTTRQNHKIAV